MRGPASGHTRICEQVTRRGKDESLAAIVLPWNGIGGMSGTWPDKTHHARSFATVLAGLVRCSPRELDGCPVAAHDDYWQACRQ